MICPSPRPISACTAFLVEYENRRAYAYNMDWTIDDAIVLVNKRNINKNAAAGLAGPIGAPAAWTSRYGSLTFNQFGLGMPHIGVNEKGLGIALLHLAETSYPPTDERKVLNSLQWIQYQLDMHQTVEEVLQSNDYLRIVPDIPVSPHYFVCDSGGTCAVIEFIEGKPAYFTGPSLPVKALTNNLYPESIMFFRKFEGMGAAFPVPGDGDSLNRFLRAANMIKAYEPPAANTTVDYAFTALVYTSAWDTKWNIVSDLQKGMVYFRTFKNQRIRYVDLKQLDFDCQTPHLMLDINAPVIGDAIGSFKEYDNVVNERLLADVFEKLRKWENIILPPPRLILDNSGDWDGRGCKPLGAAHPNH